MYYVKSWFGYLEYGVFEIGPTFSLLLSNKDTPTNSTTD